MERDQLRQLIQELKDLRRERKEYIRHLHVEHRGPTEDEIKNGLQRESRITDLEMTPSVVPLKKLRWTRIVLVDGGQEPPKF